MTLAFVVHQVEALAVMASFDGALGIEEFAGVGVPVTIAAGGAEFAQVFLPALAEAFEDLVFEGEKESATPRIALAGGAADELAVDACGLMALGADDMEPAGLDDDGLIRARIFGEFHLLDQLLPQVGGNLMAMLVLRFELRPRERLWRCRPGGCRCHGPPYW